MTDSTNPVEEELEHFYLSTACLHGLHSRCQQTCMWCDAECLCQHHQPSRPEETP